MGDLFNEVSSEQLSNLTPFDAWINGSKVCATANEVNRLVNVNTRCRMVRIRALAANTGLIYVGGNNDLSTSNATEVLNANEVLSIAINDVRKICIFSSVNGEGVAFSYVV